MGGRADVPKVNAVNDTVGLGRVEEIAAHHVDAHGARTTCIEVGGWVGDLLVFLYVLER